MINSFFVNFLKGLYLSTYYFTLILQSLSFTLYLTGRSKGSLFFFIPTSALQFMLAGANFLSILRNVLYTMFIQLIRV